MIRTALIVAAFFSLFFFPFPFALTIALAAAITSPLAPLALGIFADLLYYAPNASVVPLYTGLGALTALCSFGIRRFVESSIISPRH